jgi:S1 RNA binding domain protein
MAEELKIGQNVEAEVFKITDFGAFVKLANNARGLIHISQVADTFVKDINAHLKIGDKIVARITKISPDGKIDLSLKKEGAASAEQNSAGRMRGREFRTDFEEKLRAFLRSSQEIQADLKKQSESKLGGRPK